MQEYTQSGGVKPFGCCVFQNLERRYKDGLSIDDGLGIIISTLREGYDGEITEKNIEIAKFPVNRCFFKSNKKK